MSTLPVILPSRRLQFTETGDVLDSQNKSVGRWSAESSDPTEQNCLIFRDQNGPRQVIKARYAFNNLNQLTVSLEPADGTVTEKSEVTFNGEIAIDDERDVVYALANAPASKTGQVVVVYGGIGFDGANSLVVTLTGGGSTAIKGDDTTPLSAEQNNDVALAGRDLLVFHASTTNVFGAQKDHRPASISFAGQWKLLPDGISFECSVDGDLTNPDLVLKLKGRSKAVAAGLEFQWKEGAASALLIVEGQHTFDAGSATWSIAVGFSQLAEPAKRINASAKGQITHTAKNGSELVIAGELTYQGDGGKVGTLALEIAAEYSFAAGKLTFKATANFAGTKVQYDLQLGGEIKVLNGKLVFEVKYSSAGTTSFTVNYQGLDSEFLKFFNVSISRDATGRVTAAVKFSIELHYINGVQVSKTT